MGYALHITRASDWRDSREHPIAVDEWIAAMVRVSPSVADAVSEDPANDVFHWREDGGPLLSWSGGQIAIDGVQGEDEVAALALFATDLAARLVGEEGEEYSPDPR